MGIPCRSGLPVPVLFLYTENLFSTQQPEGSFWKASSTMPFPSITNKTNCHEQKAMKGSPSPTHLGPSPAPCCSVCSSYAVFAFFAVSHIPLQGVYTCCNSLSSFYTVLSSMAVFPSSVLFSLKCHQLLRQVFPDNSHLDCTPGHIRAHSVQSLSHIRLFVTPWTTAHQASLSITNSQNSPKPMSIESVMPSNHLILCHPLLLLPSIFSNIRVFSNESALRIRWPKYWSFSFNISPSNEHPGPISCKMDWLDLLCSPRDAQESSPTPQFKSINSSALSFLYSPTLTSIHDYWKNHSFD